MDAAADANVTDAGSAADDGDTVDTGSLTADKMTADVQKIIDREF